VLVLGGIESLFILTLSSIRNSGGLWMPLVLKILKIFEDGENQFQRLLPARVKPAQSFWRKIWRDHFFTCWWLARWSVPEFVARSVNLWLTL
jgi:hypothetical protein